MADLGGSRFSQKPLTVDCDDLNDVIRKLGVTAQFQMGDTGPTAELEISEFEDFHPDRLFAGMDLFNALRNRRKRLANASTFQEELNSIRGTSKPESNVSPTGEVPAPSDGASLLEQALDLTQARQTPLEEQVLAGTINWTDYINQLAAPYLVKKADPQQAEMLANIDSIIAESMRSVLHHPRFQQLEATWTGIHFLTRRLDTGRELQIAVLDLSQSTVSSDLKSHDDLSQTNLYRLLVKLPEEEQTAPWSLIVGDYQFGTSPGDLEVLGRIGRIAASAGSAFVSSAASGLAGCPGFGTAPDPDDWDAVDLELKSAWHELRALTCARYLALAQPKILARRVYGRDTDPIESFAFTELPDGTQHNGYLWMNPGFGIAALIGQAYLENGWAISRCLEGELDRLPIHYYDDGGEECVKACGEAYLVDRAAEKLSNLGLTVTRSVRNDGAVRFERIRSISSAAPDLSGPWS